MGITDDVKKAFKKSEEREEKKPRLDETDFEKLRREHKELCENAGARLENALDMMADQGLPPEVAEFVGMAYGDVEKLKGIGSEMVKQYRGDLAECEEHLKSKDSEKESKEKNSEAIKAIKKKYVGIKGNEKKK